MSATVTTKSTKKKIKKPGLVSLKAVPAAPAMRIPVQTMVQTASIHRASYNPRTMPPEKMLALKASLRKHGFVLNLVVQAEADDGTENVLIGGHQRLTAIEDIAKEDGLPLPERVPVVILDVSDAEAKQLNVALNNVEGVFDPYKLGELFAGIRDTMTPDDVIATGFSSIELDQVISLITPVDDQIAQLEAEIALSNDGLFSKIPILTVEFASVEQRNEAKELLKKLTLAAPGKKAGDIMHVALQALDSE